jgi:hypothetical protein
METTLALDSFRRACDAGRGAVFFSVARGKVREGGELVIRGKVREGVEHIRVGMTRVQVWRQVSGDKG